MEGREGTRFEKVGNDGRGGGVKVKAQLTHVKVRRQDRNEPGDLGRYLLTIDYRLSTIVLSSS